MSSKSRLAFIDLLRGWAMLVMIEVHVFNAFFLPEIRTAAWFGVLNFVNGWVAPSFIFISGFVFLLASQKKLESFRTYGSAFWKQLSRIGLVLLVGYFLHLPFFSLCRMMNETDQAGWFRFYQSDVLHCIAIGLLILFLARLAIKSTRIYRNTLFIAGVAVLLVTPLMWSIDFVSMIPAPLAAYLNGWHYSLFPLFPWIGFMLFGGYFAAGYIEARETGKEKNYILKFALIGSLLLSLSVIIRELPIHAYLGSSEVRTDPFFFAERLGIVMLLLTICWFYAEWRKTEQSVVLDASKESLMVYAAHLLVIYGQFWHDHSLYFYYGKTAGIFPCVVGTLALMAVMVVAAKLWGWLKRNHLPLARVLFWMFAAATMMTFMMR
jgi:uncharacterized membrane protein